MKNKPCIGDWFYFVDFNGKKRRKKIFMISDNFVYFSFYMEEIENFQPNLNKNSKIKWYLRTML